MAKEQDHPNTNKNIHPPIVALLFIVMAYLLGRFAPLPFVVPLILRNIGLLLTFIGFLLGIGAFVEFRKARTTLDPHGSTKQLVTSGIYRFTRNPIYLGFLLMVIGLPLNSGLYWGVVLAPFYIIVMNRLVIEREEIYLEKKFKDAFTSYKSRVRRWL
jgi:protein-S-isoprenylcysteine O-methyltransferase Ste14